MKLSYVAAGLLATAVQYGALIAAHAATSNNEYSVVLDGIVSHGAIECNPAWLDRRGAVAILGLAQSSGIHGAKVKQLISRGMHDFDNHVREKGKDAACMEVDGIISKMEK
jgi:hypothetical protein